MKDGEIKTKKVRRRFLNPVSINVDFSRL